MDQREELRRSLLNQLESLQRVGLTHVQLEPPEERPGAGGSVPLGDVQTLGSMLTQSATTQREANHGGKENNANPSDEVCQTSQEDTHDSDAPPHPARNVKIEASWKRQLAGALNAPYMATLSAFLRTEKAHGKRIYPPGGQIFRAFELTPFDDAKVVILGQDPYHGAGQAHGLSFSVANGVQPPPSLRNIYRELETDLGIPHPGHGNLTSWARQGVLLLNTCLTVEEGLAGSHHGKGWEMFTDEVIRCLNDELENLVFILWGRKAQDKGTEIDCSRHHVISSPHPSPLSASNGFFGSKPFSRANAYLEETNQAPIDWNPR